VTGDHVSRETLCTDLPLQLHDPFTTYLSQL
jgi:hypothetical protein